MEEKTAIKVAAAPFAGQTVKIFYPMNDAEASQYAGDFATVLIDAGWKCEVRGWFYPYEGENVTVAMCKPKDGDASGAVPPKALRPLVKALMGLGISKNRGLDPETQANTLDDIEPGEIGMRVAAKMAVTATAE